MKKFLPLFGAFLLTVAATAQYAPPAGVPGTTAIHQDSAVFTGWATQCTLSRGWQNVADTTLGITTTGTASSALGKPDNDVVSLGDGGAAILGFDAPVVNGPGWDFAVFENSFDGLFLELAFVEVSSDGIHFYRFPAHSLTQDSTQVGSFGRLDATKIHNLAGKYKSGYGVPFDLEELKNEPGLDVNHITAIKIIDVTGSLDSGFCSYDTAGNKINDPWPTPFPSSGFDLDGAGVIHSQTGRQEVSNSFYLKIFPNPATDYIHIESDKTIDNVVIRNMQGQKVFQADVKGKHLTLDRGGIVAGFYVVEVRTARAIRVRKILIGDF